MSLLGVLLAHMKIRILFLSVFWHKYVPVLRKSSKKKAQSLKLKANDTDYEIHIKSSSSDDDFKSPPKKKKPFNRDKKIKKIWAKHYPGKFFILTLCFSF